MHREEQAVAVVEEIPNVVPDPVAAAAPPPSPPAAVVEEEETQEEVVQEEEEEIQEELEPLPAKKEPVTPREYVGVYYREGQAMDKCLVANSARRVQQWVARE